MGGQIVDATIVAAPRQRMTDAGKEIVKGIEVWKRGASRLIGRPIPGNRRKRIATRVGRSSVASNSGRKSSKSITPASRSSGSPAFDNAA